MSTAGVCIVVGIVAAVLVLLALIGSAEAERRLVQTDGPFEKLDDGLSWACFECGATGTGSASFDDHRCAALAEPAQRFYLHDHEPPTCPRCGQTLAFGGGWLPIYPDGIDHFDGCLTDG